MLHLTKVAYGCTSLAALEEAVARRTRDGRIVMTTRFLPKRHAEVLDGGSLYWIIKHQLVARAPILAFAPTPEGRFDIVLEARVTPVLPQPRRAHQGWRYLEPGDAPRDLAGGLTGSDALPASLLGELADLSLI